MAYPTPGVNKDCWRDKINSPGFRCQCSAFGPFVCRSSYETTSQCSVLSVQCSGFGCQVSGVRVSAHGLNFVWNFNIRWQKTVSDILIWYIQYIFSWSNRFLYRLTVRRTPNPWTLNSEHWTPMWSVKKVSSSINLAVCLASGPALMKLRLSVQCSAFSVQVSGVRFQVSGSLLTV